jgi:hypothetical protein
MRKLPTALVIVMFCASVAMALGYSIYKEDILSSTLWWIAASINAHSFITLATYR